MRHPNEKHSRSAQIGAVLGMGLLALTWLYFDFAVVGTRSSLALIFVLSLYYFRQDLLAFAFRIVAPLVFWLNDAELTVWKISVFVPIVLYFALTLTGLTRALPSLKKKKRPLRKRHAAH